MADNFAVPFDCSPSTTRGTGFSSSVVDDWGVNRTCGSCLYRGDGAAGNAPLSRQRRSLEARTGAGGRVAYHGRAALPLFSQRQGQRRSSD